MGKSMIAVPIHLDALYVSDPKGVVPPMADFKRLPYFDGARDINPQVPWLGESAASEPFGSSTLTLQKGIHLHWRFPKGLTTGIQSADKKIVFPDLPDRWLVTRGHDTGSAQVVEDQWVVESNYLHPDGVIGEGAVYPLNKETTGRCYRYMGRAVPLKQWLIEDQQRNPPKKEYLDSRLTVAGYGEPTFASFYPNCSRQFGFHDPEYGNQIPPGLYYQVIGWYSEARKDWLQFLMKFDRQPDETWKERFDKVLKERLGWSVKGDPTVDVVIACHGSLVFRPQPNLLWEPQLKNPVVTFGATITEALSAYLASEVAAGDPAKKDLIEDKLEAIMLDRTLSNRTVDLGAKFKEARHQKGFDEVYAGVVWVVRAETTSADTTPNAKPDPNADLAPWPDVAEKLATLNRLQNAYQLAWDEIRSLRQRLYSDWCRYMRLSYAPADATAGPNAADVRFIIEQQMSAIERKLADVGVLEFSRSKPDGPPSFSVPPSFSETKPFSLARQIAAAFESILASLSAHQNEPGVKTRYVIQPEVAPRYWSPTEPVILLVGEAVRVDEPFHVEDIDGDKLLVCELKALHDPLATLRTDPSGLHTNFKSQPRVWTEQPWHPLLLQWEVELTPLLRLANLTTPDHNYNEQFITKNFTLRRSDVDLSAKTNAGELDAGQPAPDPFVYKGSSLLTPHVVDQFMANVYGFLERVKKQQPKVSNDPFPWNHLLEGHEEYASQETIDFLIQRLLNDPPNGLADDTIRQLGDILKKLQSGFFCLAQRLSGFNEALLMHRQTLRIPIRNPIGFEDDQTLARNVAHAIEGEAQHAPQPGKAFSPIRAGELRVKRLRLVSTFGRQLDFQVQNVITSMPMQSRSNRAAAVFLPPRLVQPARLQFRWLAADVTEQEMNAHPDSTPICGWVIANHLDDNLFFYSTCGQVLGYMEVEADARVRWRPAPGAQDPVIRLDQIENTYLRRLVAFFLDGSADYFNQFLTDLEAAQELIEPEHSGDPMLMGQPLAFVRAKLNLELQGLPAIQRNWMDPHGRRARGESETDRFTGVRFPIRLGEQDQFNDGLTVYWLENQDGTYQDDAYVIPNYQEAASAQDKKCDFLYQSIDDAPLHISMLIDPRGVVHAATGILPAKSIQIPPHQYANAIKRFEIMFLTAPVLAGLRPEKGPRTVPTTVTVTTPAIVLNEGNPATGPEAGPPLYRQIVRHETAEDTIALPVTDPPGYEWTWVEKRGDEWINPSINAADLFKPFAGDTEIREGWLKLALPKEKKVTQPKGGNDGR